MSASLDAPAAPQPKFRVARQARFGRAPRIQVNPAAKPDRNTPARRRSDAEKDFEAAFTRMAHLQRFRGVRDAIRALGEVTQRTCRGYATFSDAHGTQFAVVKPLPDGGLRVGVGDFPDIASRQLDPASGLGGSSRINFQFELPGHRVLSGQHIGLLRRAFRAASAEA